MQKICLNPQCDDYVNKRTSAHQAGFLLATCPCLVLRVYDCEGKRFIGAQQQPQPQQGAKLWPTAAIWCGGPQNIN